MVSKQEKIFVSYNRADRAWAEWIAAAVERAGYRPIIQAWDFRPGENFIVRMQQSSEEADITLPVLTEAYLESLYTKPEWAAAFAQDPTGKKRRLVPVRVAECTLKGMLASIIYIDLVGIDAQDAERVLADGLKLSGRPAQPPSFPVAKPGILRVPFPPKVEKEVFAALRRDFPTDPKGYLAKGLKTWFLRKLVGELCELKAKFEHRWSDTVLGVDGPMPSLDHIGSCVKEPVLRSLIESQTKELEDSLLKIVAQKQSSFIVRALNDFYLTKGLTKPPGVLQKVYISILGVVNRLQIEVEKRAFERFRINLANVLLCDLYIDVKELHRAAQREVH
jgi:hypothetical protein